MRNRNAGPVVLRARSAPWLTGIVWLIAAIGAGSAWLTHGGTGLLQSLPLLAAAYVAWWLAWFPAVVVSDDGIRLRPMPNIGTVM